MLDAKENRHVLYLSRLLVDQEIQLVPVYTWSKSKFLTSVPVRPLSAYNKLGKGLGN